MNQRFFRILILLGLIAELSWLFMAVDVNAAQKTSGKFRFYDEQSKKWYRADIRSGVRKHHYDWNRLKWKKKKPYYNDGTYKIRRGIDVSHHNKTIQWKKVKKAGISFAFIRIAYRGYGRNGRLCIDRQFYRNIKNAKKAGIDVGVYIFSQAVNTKEAKEEAQLVLDTLKGITLELPVVYDPERIIGAKARTDGMTRGQCTRNAIAFCKKIKAAGYQPMLYSNMYWEAFRFNLKKLSDYPIWYADYKKKPQTPYDFSFWQYSSKGTVPGISGKVDLNVEFMQK